MYIYTYLYIREKERLYLILGKICPRETILTASLLLPVPPTAYYIHIPILLFLWWEYGNLYTLMRYLYFIRVSSMRYYMFYTASNRDVKKKQKFRKSECRFSVKKNKKIISHVSLSLSLFFGLHILHGLYLYFNSYQLNFIIL